MTISRGRIGVFITGFSMFSRGGGGASEVSWIGAGWTGGSAGGGTSSAAANLGAASRHATKTALMALESRAAYLPVNSQSAERGCHAATHTFQSICLATTAMPPVAK